MAGNRTGFFSVVTLAEALGAFDGLPLADAETVPTEKSLDRVLAGDVQAAEDVPHFDRAVMDGYAVRAADTFGCSESQPAYLTVQGTVEMGVAPPAGPSPGGALRISTGGMMPSATDAVVMWEYTRLEKDLLEVYRPVAPGENVARRAEDVARGEFVLRKGRRLRPADVGLLAGIGQSEVAVRRPPRVAIISTGDELVAPVTRPGPGQVRNINQFSLGAWVERCGGEPLRLGLVPDDGEKIASAVEKGLAEASMVLISGGSSAGTRDLTRGVVASVGSPGLLFHGLAVKPGKPTVIGARGGQPVIGLPGHPVSAMVVFLAFVRPLVNRFLGRHDDAGILKIPARMADNVPSLAGREDFCQVRLEQDGGELAAVPIFRKSGLITSMVGGDGMVRIPGDREGLEAGEKVTVEVYR